LPKKVGKSTKGSELEWGGTRTGLGEWLAADGVLMLIVGKEIASANVGEMDAQLSGE
jgi:hypothetical protein